MAILHELLAVAGNLKQQAEKTRLELLNTFEKKKHHFSKQIVTFKSLIEGVPDQVETQLDLQTTVPQEIDWLKPFQIKAIDAAYQVAIANTKAAADIVQEDGTTFEKDVPATALLELEKWLKIWQEFFTHLPTLDPAKGFTPDPAQGEYIFAARAVNSPRTKKTKKIYTLAPATEKHPAQTQLIDEDMPTGTINTLEWSGLITPARKGQILEHVDDLLRAVKKARARANEIDVDTARGKIGAKCFDRILAA